MTQIGSVPGLQHLPARQRAVLILRDVLAWRAVEVAELLDTTTAAVNSVLQRARAQLAQVAPAEDEVVEPTEPGHRALLDRYVAAFEEADITALTKLLRDDAVLEMPPFLTWFAGRDAVGRGWFRQTPTANPRSLRTCAAATASITHMRYRCSP